MNNTALVIIVVLIIAGGAYYLLANKSSGGATTQPPTTAAPTAPVPNTSPATAVAVNIQNFSFNPSLLSIKTGTKVTWTNNDTVSHTVTSDSSSLLQSPTLAPGQSFSFTFTTPGSVSYHCSIHPMMKGTISVTN